MITLCDLNVTLSLLSNFSDSIDSLSRFGNNVETIFLTLPFSEGVVQCVLNVVVLASIVAILIRSRRRESPGEKPALIFVGSLAVSDLLQFCVMVAIVANYHRDGGDVNETSSNLRSHCYLQLSLWLFCISSNLFNTILITADRYVFITRCIRYPSLVTQTRSLLALALSWLLSLAVSVSPMLLRHVSPDFDGSCVFNHLVPSLYTVAMASTMLVVLLLTYAMYGVILVKYQRKRRMLREARRRGGTFRMGRGESGDEKKQQDRSLALKSTLIRVGGFIQAAQYVIFLLLAFTVAWTPYIVTMFSDVVSDVTGHRRVRMAICREEKEEEDLYWRKEEDDNEDLLVEALHKIRHVIHTGDAVTVSLPCPSPSSSLSLCCCSLVARSLHGYEQHHRQMLAVTVGVLHSVLNPIIYAFWYPQFRRQVRALTRLCRMRNDVGLYG